MPAAAATGPFVEQGSGIGRALMVAGGVLFLLGLAVTVGGRLGLGRLPGDLVWRSDRGTVFFPIVTSLLLSLVLTVVLWVVRRFL
jgi:hypothetical protein